MFEGLVYQFVYNLKRHRLFNITLRNWLIFLCVTLPVATWLGLWQASHLVAVVVTLCAAGTLAATWWAGRRRYVRFVDCDQVSPHPSGKGEVPDRKPVQELTSPPMPVMSKLRVRATGFFEVSGNRRYFVETPADYTTFETREHCVMTRMRLSRFLLLGKSHDNEVGWWYTFFQPDMIRSVDLGWLYFGLHPRPALRLEIASPDEPNDEVLHLSFDDQATRSLVLADLQYDHRDGNADLS